MIEVSIIVPNFNHSRFLKKRIDSILNQTFQDFEIIILDDCSTDSSREIIEEYKTNPKVTNVIYNKTNSGTTFKQWKKGIELAKGDFIWIAESDDYASIHFIEKLLPYLIADENVSLAYCDSVIVNEKDELRENIRSWLPNLHNPGKIFEKSNIANGRDLCFYEFCYRNIFPNTSAILSRKSALLAKYSFIDTKMRNNGDWKFWFHVSIEGKIAYHNEELNFFRKHSYNVTSSLLTMKLEALIFLKELLKLDLNEFERSQIYDSILKWSFNPAIWVSKKSFDHSNIRYYFKNNISVKSFSAFVKYLFKSY